MSLTTLTFAYKPKPWATIFTIAICAALSVFAAHEALTNDRGLVINRVLHLSVHGATTFYWCLAASVGTGALFMVPLSFLMFLRSHRIELTESAISAPKFAYSKVPTIVPFSEIKKLSLQTMHKQRLLHIYHRQGRLSIVQSFLPNASAFDQILTHLARHVPT